MRTVTWTDRMNPRPHGPSPSGPDRRARSAIAVSGVLAISALLATPVSSMAQGVTVGTGVDYLGYSFDDGLGAEAAQLLMVPVAMRIPVGGNLSLDLFSAWAEGRVERNGGTLTLSGPVDTNVKASWRPMPWVTTAVTVNVPTGDGTHDDQEAIVASVLSTDLLGFREATWGTGLAVTSSLGLAGQAGGFGMGVAAAYAVRGEFEPSEDVSLTYRPGNESRIRVGFDRNFGNSTLTFGGTFINFQEDRVTDDVVTDQNLFQAGNRYRFDVSYAFRAGAGVWTFYGADLIRENGDLRVDVTDSTFVQTASQNLVVGGVIGTMGLGGGYVFRPHVDVRYQTREEADGNEAGSGWITAVGGDVPVRLLGSEFFPKARVYFGAIRSLTGEDVSLLGMELKGTIRVGF